MRQGYLKAIVKAGPDAGTRALRRLSKLLADPLVADLDPAGLKGATGDHLAAIAKSDWAGLAHLVSPAGPHPQSRIRWLPARWVRRGRRFVDVASGRATRRQVISELALLRRSVDDMRKEQRRLEANLQAEFQLRDMLAGRVEYARGSHNASEPGLAVVLPSNAGGRPPRPVGPAEGRCQVRQRRIHDVDRKGAPPSGRRAVDLAGELRGVRAGDAVAAASVGAPYHLVLHVNTLAVGGEDAPNGRTG